jgi:phosphohistidine swiveling domain-containing protein
MTVRSPLSAVRGPIIVSLEEANIEREVGGKAANLARLLRLGVAVPQGFVVTDSALRMFLEAADLEPAIDAMCGTLGGKSPIAVRCAAETIIALVRAETLPAAVDAAVTAAFEELAVSRVIVRSSAVGEDSAGASFAGQLDSIFDITTAPALGTALGAVWASRWSERVLAYQEARHVSLDGMGVIVQAQIDAVLSGVLFTRAPGDDSRMLVEYCGGLGEALVSGQENPGRLTIVRSNLTWTREAEPERHIPAEATLLDDRAISTLGSIALTIEAAFGAPQDIEWTIDRAGTVWIVQARPITASRQSTVGSPQSGVSNPTVLWSNANVNENFPQPICPLLYSIAREGYYHYFRNLGRAFGISRRRLAAMETPLRQIIGVHGARMYYNLTNIHTVLRSAPFGDRLAASFNQFVGADELAPRSAGDSFAARARNRATQSAELIVIAAKTAWQYAFLTRRVERLERTVDAFARQTHPDRLARRKSLNLLEDFRGFLDIRCRRWNDAALADAGSMVCYGILKALLARAFPSADQQALHNTLLKALPGLVSSTPPLELWKLSRTIRADRDLAQLFATAPSGTVLSAITQDPRFEVFRGSFESFLEQWGFRCSAELMLTVPSFQEEPEPVVDLLKAYASMDGESPVALLDRQQRDRIRETERVLTALHGRRLGGVPFLSESAAIGLVLRWTQTSIQLRERARLKQALLYSRLRRIVLAIGADLAARGRIARAEDLFFLTSGELDALVSGSEMFPDHVTALVELRRRAHRDMSATTPPDAIRLVAGEYVPAASGDEGVATLAAEPAAGGMRGVGACGGSITGRATVLADVSQSHLLSPGDVLVTRQTDPGWGPVFPLIAGLVIERGGMLSHGAIIAREFGIPSVVGVKDATRLIPQGGTVLVDGDRGFVRIIPGAA